MNDIVNTKPERLSPAGRVQGSSSTAEQVRPDKSEHAVTALAPFEPGLTPWPHDVERLIERWQEGRSPHTVRAYGRDLAHFARWSEAAAPGEAITRLLTGSMGEANERLHAYRGAMLDAGLAPATVNRRLSALRSVVQLGRTFGLVTWSIEIDGVKTKAYRDTAGPGLEGVTAVKRQAAKHRSPAKAARDVAIIRAAIRLGIATRGGSDVGSQGS